jgi:pectin methylesterase-like acyl-CoA thioesterase
MMRGVVVRIRLLIAAHVLASACQGSDGPHAAAVESGGAGNSVVAEMGGAGAQHVPNAGTGASQAGRVAAGTAGMSGMPAADGGPRARSGSGAEPPVAGQGGHAASAAGSGGSVSAPVSTGPLFPENGGKDLCPDASLRMHFSAPPTVGNSGKIQVFKMGAAGSPVAVVDLGVTMVNETLGGTAFKLQRPVYVAGNDLIVRLPPHSLGYGQGYYVTVDAGAIMAPGGTSMTISGSAAWQFSTRTAAPSDLSMLRVAVDGSGQFCSVQGALDALPANNNAATTITIGRGTYFEVVHVASKNNITLHGEDRKATVILGVNNNNLNPSTATRSLVGIDRSSGFVIDSLTIHNLTPQGGSQAEALRMQSCDQCVVRHADIISLQDTLLWSGRIYASDSYIEGNVDFVWGTGVALFDHCEIKTVGRAGVIVQSRNDAAKYGYVFVDSKLTADPGLSGNMLGRIDVSAYPGSHVAYVNCQMGNHIAPAGWTITGGTASASLRFWEYQSTDAAGAPLDVSHRVAGSKQITAADAMKMRDAAEVFGGWTPPK